MESKELFDDLVALEECSFPKKCETCGAVYNSVEDFTQKTAHINQKSGLKASEDDDGETILELFRNCVCGSTLLDFFADRRDMSEAGNNRRQAFEKVLKYIIKQGIERDVAREELKYYLKHKKSELLAKLGVFKMRINRNK
ncbi:oxidoreductase [Aliikangiella sp. IMCC44359]|uniref:oxidoreductase n=1 Tax=Aliikangiella sp. IMCC44359 TaxID=3459125 RepID=UPI00403B0124